MRSWPPRTPGVALIGGALTPALVADAFRVTTLETLPVLAAAGPLLQRFRRVASGRPPEPGAGGLTHGIQIPLMGAAVRA